MDSLKRSRYLILTLKVYNVKQIRNLKLGNASYKRNISLPQIPNAPQVLEKFYSMKTAEISYNEKLLNELILECTKDNYKTCEEYLSKNIKEKRSFIKMPLLTLQERNLVSSTSSITNQLLSYLEPFPFDKKRIWEKEKTGKINLNFIRKTIEKGYLAWKYNVNIEKIDNIFSTLKYCLNDFKSIRNLKETVSLLETVPNIQNQSVAEKIYHLNQKPFDLNNVINFEDKIAGIIWHAIPNICPKLLQHSHQHILFVVSVLKALNFTESQIQIGLPFLVSEFTVLIEKLNDLLGNTKLLESRNEPEFLQLLYFKKDFLSTMNNLQETSFKELIELINISKSNTAQKRVRSSVMYLASQFYKIDKKQVMNTIFGSNLKFVSTEQIYETLAFLKEAGFTSKEVQESLAIIFYPSSYIKETLDKIKKDEEYLKNIGYSDGCIVEKNFFTNGTKQKRKLLQLCLYYMEKPFNFSGSGVGITRESDDGSVPSEKQNIKKPENSFKRPKNILELYDLGTTHL